MGCGNFSNWGNFGGYTCSGNNIHTLGDRVDGRSNFIDSAAELQAFRRLLNRQQIGDLNGDDRVSDWETRVAASAHNADLNGDDIISGRRELRAFRAQLEGFFGRPVSMSEARRLAAKTNDTAMQDASEYRYDSYMNRPRDAWQNMYSYDDGYYYHP